MLPPPPMLPPNVDVDDVEGMQIVMLATLGDDAPPIPMPLMSFANSSSGLRWWVGGDGIIEL